MQIGTYFLEQGRITEEQFALAQNIQKTIPNKRLGKIFIDLGLITQTELVNYLSQYNPEALVEEKTLHSTPPVNLLKKYKAAILSESADYIFAAGFNDKIETVLSEHIGKKVKLEPVELTFLYEQINKSSTHKINLHNPNELIDFIIKEAVDSNVSDIHIELIKEYTAVRYRWDGVLHVKYIFPKNTGEMLIARLKGMGNMDIAEKRYPQDGSFSYAVSASKDIYIRLSSLPAYSGEVLVLRVLDKEKVLISLDRLGIEKLEDWKRAIRERNGLILVTGATGSGKSTTLYTTLLHLDRIGRNILTIEDPVEYQFPFIRQVQVNSVLKLDFKVFLKHAMRQDPDVILVGEVRDEETARTMVQAAETGHLVFATLHSNDIPSTFNRLVDLGINPSDLKYLLRAVLSQTLLRKVCHSCKGKKCMICNYTGYRNRALASELMVFTPETTELLRQDKPIKYRTIKDNACRLMEEGIIDRFEFERVFGG